jgi:hypothetical protein
MKRLFLIATALLALTGGANAVEMPKELRGVWCLVDGSRDTYAHAGECTIRNGLGVDASGFDIPNGDCLALNVSQIATRAYRIRFRCQDDIAKPLVIDQTWRIKNDILKVYSVRRR